LLKTHSSTKERLNDYIKLIKLIRKYNPRSILDLGCGINPIAIADKFPKTSYYAHDIKQDELKLIDLFFKSHKIAGKTYLKDITKIKNLPNTDICIVFKVLDIIETKGHEKAKNILQKIQSKKIIVSFSTITLSGKPMNSPRRLWFENLLNSLGYKFNIMRTRNEVFYFIEKPLLH